MFTSISDSWTHELKQARLQILAPLESFRPLPTLKCSLKAIVFFYLSFVLEQTQLLLLNTGYSKCVRGSRLQKDRSRDYRNGRLHRQQYAVNQSKIYFPVEIAYVPISREILILFQKSFFFCKILL